MCLYSSLIIKFLANRCPFFSGRVRLWRRFLRLCCVSDSGGNSSTSRPTWCLQWRSFQNSVLSAAPTSSSAEQTVYHFILESWQTDSQRPKAALTIFLLILVLLSEICSCLSENCNRSCPPQHFFDPRLTPSVASDALNSPRISKPNTVKLRRLLEVLRYSVFYM